MVLNGQPSEERKVLTSVPQGSVLGPLLFLIFINDIPANLECNVKIFADDTFLFFFLVCDPNESSAKLSTDLGRVDGRISGRCNLIPILLSKLWKFTFHVRLTL